MQPQQFRFFVLTHRDPRYDFRRPLVEALRQRYDTYYVWLNQRPVISGPDQNDPPVEMSLTQLAGFFLRFRRKDKINIYFNSASTAWPFYLPFLRLIANTGVWCLDMHDDLRYHYAGLRRLQMNIAVMLARFFSDVTVHASPQLTELFPDSRHLGNASHILPLPREVSTDQKILILASFDERCDFVFLAKVAELCPTFQFHLYGWARPNDDLTREMLTAICDRHANIRYCGPFALDSLPTILSDFRICLAPYVTGSLMTRYIDPLRFYHCLNSGMEVVSTSIPQAEHMIDWIHIVRDPLECAETLKALLYGEIMKGHSYTPITWVQRVDRLVAILGTLPRTLAVGAKIPVR
jgi:hypothetical protein